jgi:hypothetical protein
MAFGFLKLDVIRIQNANIMSGKFSFFFFFAKYSFHSRWSDRSSFSVQLVTGLHIQTEA